MAIAVEGGGIRSTTAALASQIHPVFMLPPLAASGFGAIVAGRIEPVSAGIHIAAIFFAVYIAHVKDGYVDYYCRQEDTAHPLTVRGCRLALWGATAGFGSCLLLLWWLVSFGAVIITLPTWFLGYFHAPQLDTRPITATMGYPVGISLTILGGYFVQTTELSTVIIGYATVFLLLLAGIKIIDDAQDLTFDRSINKRTIPVVLGWNRARVLAQLLMVLAMIGVLLSSLLGFFPPATPVSVVAYAVILFFARRAPPDIATMLLIRGAYVFLALLIVAIWFRPLSFIGS